MKRLISSLGTIVALMLAGTAVAPAASAAPAPGQFQITSLNGPAVVTLSDIERTFPVTLTYTGTPADKPTISSSMNISDDDNGDGATIVYEISSTTSRGTLWEPYAAHVGRARDIKRPRLDDVYEKHLKSPARLSLSIEPETTPGKYTFLIPLTQRYNTGGSFDTEEYTKEVAYTVTVIAPKKLLRHGVSNKSVRHTKKRTKVQFDVDTDALTRAKVTLQRKKPGTKKWRKAKTVRMGEDGAKISTKRINKRTKLRVVVDKTAYTKKFKFRIK
ncbi:hypothetical protein SAMN06309944_2415 [Micrococcales bacterium KH10]|nr:hypothetical protein SAMN06309944_2415 [Micrococcales bacterium KH10]